MKIYEIIAANQADEKLVEVAGLVKGIKRAKDAVRSRSRSKAKTGAEVTRNTAQLAATAEVSATAMSKIKSFGSAYVTILSSLGILYYVGIYWTEILKLEADWTEYQNSVKSNSQVPSSNIFAGKDYEAALNEAATIRTDLLGKAVAGCLMSAGIFGKVLRAFGSMVKVIPIFGTLVGSPLRGLGWVISKMEGGPIAATVRASFLTWLETTDSGKEFMKNIFVVLILGGVGKVASGAISALMGLADLAVDFINEKFGTNITKPSDSALGTKIKPDAAVRPSSKTGVVTDPAVNKTTGKLINPETEIVVTDANGKLLNNAALMANAQLNLIRRQAIAAGKPDPLAQFAAPGQRLPNMN
jgi:hypothetical protein